MNSTTTIKKFDWKRFRKEASPDIFYFIKINFEREMTKAEYIKGANKVIKVENCPPAPLRRFGDTLSKQYDWLKSEYGAFTGKVTRKGELNETSKEQW